MIRVRNTIFSLTGLEPPKTDYLRWHLLDHMPEQYQLPGLVYALRYIADGDYPAARIAGEGPLAGIGNLVNYFIGEPVVRSHEEFLELGVRLAEAGRFPERRTPLGLRSLALTHWYAAPSALVSAEVIPMRPHRGIVLIIEEPTQDDVSPWLNWLHTEHIPAVLGVPGVAGAWQYSSSAYPELHEAYLGDPQHATVIYLDEDPLETLKGLTPLLEQRWASGQARPLFAGPLRTPISWEAWPR
ncbi:hypothetical protein MXD61_13855 [Frankia sp. AgPm24]|uniref:DUF5753 domain-containing protein n=1 Tax=Frankia umida TaxID=573489 RepID=A0ABT0K4J9_9ACTN|nr:MULTISPECIES: hypothetical protein [Frankia]MCK9878729.1 hypothetical protein [Frankia umida]MCK9922942.1 hypothetical protein [Frankia sp. AgPm24]